MKKVISLLLVFILLIGCFSVSVSANGNIVVMGQMHSKRLHGASATNHKQTAQEVLAGYVDLSTFTSLVMSGVSDCQEYIDVSDYNIPISIFKTISDYFFYGVPEAFNVNQMGYSYYGGVNTIASIVVVYNSFADTTDEYDNCIDKMNAATNTLLTDIKGNITLTDEQKLLLLHDRLVIWNTYGYPANTTSIEAHTAYGALCNKMSVCQGYAMAYMYLLNQVGIESYYCSSDTLNHGWNIVFLNGKKYHVDVTWDDPTPDRFGRVEHDNFLRSSNGIYATGHEAFDFDYSPNDTTYDSYFWQNSSAEFQLVNNEIYYIDSVGEEIKRYSDKNTLISVEATWPAGDKSYWSGNFSCLATDGVSLFYSQPKSIYRFDLTTDTSEIIYTPSLGSDKSIFGFSYQDETLICDISDAPNNIKYQITQKYKYDYNPKTLYGDANGDGNVNARDYSMLIQHLNGWSVVIDTNAADVNNDGNVNARDYSMLIQYLNGWSVTLGPK